MAMAVAFPCQMPVCIPGYMVSTMAPVVAPVMLASMAGVSAQPTVSSAPLPAVCSATGMDSKPALSQHHLKEAVTAEQSRFALIAKDALRLSLDREGCHLVQQALEEAETDAVRSAILAAFGGHVWEVSTCPHANHVLQKCIVTMKPSACQFVVDELVREGPLIASKLARHKYGYRVFQRLLEHLMPQQTAQLIEGLIADCVLLSAHRFGTYVIQHLLEHGTDGQRRQVAAALIPQMAQLSANNDACMVLDAALVRGDTETQDLLVKAILDSEDAISAMAHTRRGHVAVLSLLQLAGDELLESAKGQLAKQALALKKCRFGRLVLKSAQLDSAAAAN